MHGTKTQPDGTEDSWKRELVLQLPAQKMITFPFLAGILSTELEKGSLDENLLA